MGKRRRKLTSIKFANKFASLRASVAKLRGFADPEPTPIVEKVVSVVKPEPIIEKPAPKIAKKTSSKRVTTKKNTTTKKTPARRKTTKRSKRSTVKKDK